MPQPFLPSALFPMTQICRFCGAQRRAEPLLPPVAPGPAQAEPPTLSTIGYAGARLEQVVDALRARRIQVLLDVRGTDWREQPGFEGTTVRRAVEGRGIVYRHLPALDSAPDLRHRLREEGDWEAYAAAYLAALEQQEALLCRIAEWARRHPICLLCRERDASLCHRGLLATRLAALGGLQVEHLTLW